MRFYRIICTLQKSDAAEREATNTREVAFQISAKAVDFNGNGTSNFCFVSSISKDAATLGVLTNHTMNLIDYANGFLKAVELEADAGFVEEITYFTMESMLNTADRSSYISDADEITERFGLNTIGRHCGLDYGESLINFKAEKDELIEKAKKSLTNETLIPELERIFLGGGSAYAQGHPVHYIVETDDRDTRKDIYKTVLDALYVNQRLDSSRYSYIDFRPGRRYSHTAFESLYKVAEGGAVVIRYIADDNDEEDFASSDREIIEHICEMVKRYRNKVLTVLCLPRECKNLKLRFYDSLGAMTFVELREDFVDAVTARSLLTKLAKEKHMRTDKKLFADIEEDKIYLASELVEMFDEWYNTKLKSTVYPQYKDIAAVHKESLGNKPHGSAYDELAEMIGLSEAKSVINKAINYYKMQKLYEAKGIKRDNPAMHMIFTGNPGTAKTTVARLFARIMRENGLLSRGHLVEVGRADLVGKFVGWTAPLVQDAFKEASGGVLFIDEAYSLVDDRNGSYGDEAINTIVQEMENHRADTVVIFAGYPDKMAGFLAKNPGLRSRIAFHVPFSDYTSGELCEIAKLISRKNGMKFEAPALKKLERAFDVARLNVDFGNGRYVRNIFEQSKMNQASRLVTKDFDSITLADISTITAEDIVIPDIGVNNTKHIGFC